MKLIQTFIAHNKTSITIIIYLAKICVSKFGCCSRQLTSKTITHERHQKIEYNEINGEHFVTCHVIGERSSKVEIKGLVSRKFETSFCQ